MRKEMISGFADEICKDFQGQLEAVSELGMKYICIRAINGRNITDFSVEEAKDYIKPMLDQYGIGVSSLGSPIGKINVDDEEGFTRQCAQLETLCAIGKILNCRYIRLFSFYIPEGVDPDSCKDVVLKKLARFVEICTANDMIPLHENEKHIYGDVGVRCKVIQDAFKGTALHTAFDFANFVQCDEDPVVCYELLKDDISYIHIKDADAATHFNVLCGTGDGQIESLLAREKARGFDGFMTLEPHLVTFDTLKSLERKRPEDVIKRCAFDDGKSGYAAQYRALCDILDRI